MKIPFLDDMMQSYRTIFPTLPSQCPVMKGYYGIQNMSNGNYESVSATVSKSYGYSNYGINHSTTSFYKIMITVFSVKDPNIFTISWESEFNDNKFK